MKIGIISDTHLGHGSHLPDSIYSLFSGTDLILHAGDINFPSVIDELETIAPVQAVLGNTDPSDLELPRKRVIPANNRSIGLIHGYGAADGIEARIAKEFDDIDILVYGHTHVPCCRQTEKVLFFNPGSACVPKHNGVSPSVGLLTITDTNPPTGEILHLKN